MNKTNSQKNEKIKYASLLGIVAGIFILISGLLFKMIAVFFSPVDASATMSAREIICGRIGNILGISGMVLIVVCVIVLLRQSARNRKDNTLQY